MAIDALLSWGVVTEGCVTDSVGSAGQSVERDAGVCSSGAGDSKVVGIAGHNGLIRD